MCPACGRAGSHPGLPFAAVAQCRHCAARLPLESPSSARSGEPVRVCPLCGDDKLFQQKDFPTKVGCLILAVGAALVPWTWGLSLPVLALADLALYRALPSVTKCYVCGAQLRGLPLSPDHGPFDLLAARTWEARALAWRRRHDRH